MLVDPSDSTVGSTVTGAIRQASEATGTSFNYLLATAKVESGFDALAGAATSSARGLFQFIQQTWLATMKQAGPTLGYGQYASAITQNASGQYEVNNPVLRDEILKLRDDPAANAAMAGAFTKANAAILSDKIGRAPNDGELYMAHFLGAGGAARLINLAATSPNAKAADFFGGAAQANHSIFYDRTGAARSVAEVRNMLAARFDSARAGQTQVAETTKPVTTPAAVPPAPDTAAIADAFVAANAAVPAAKGKPNQVFLGLFADAGQSAPLAPLVSALWGVPDPTSAARGAASSQRLASGNLTDLFRDISTNGS
jgi:Transglycosylase SLT domain